MSGGRKMLITFVLAAAAFAYQYARSPSFRRQCGSVFAEWRGNGGGRDGTRPSRISGGEFAQGGRDGARPSRISGGESKRGGKWDNLELGVPGKCDQVIEREGYALGYVEAWEQPAWVAYRLTKDEVMTRKANRESAFLEDPEVKTGSAISFDY